MSKKLINYLPTHFLIALIIGILLQFYFQVWQFGFTLLLFIATFLILIGFISHKLTKKGVFTITTFIFFVFVGISSVFIHNTKNHSNYYKNFGDDNSTSLLTIKKVLKSGRYYDKYEAKVSQIDTTKTSGIILLNIKRNSLQPPLKVGDIIASKQSFKNLIPPLNPHQFDYKAYLAKQNMYHQVFVDSNQYKIVGESGFSFTKLSANIRNSIQKALEKHHFSTEEFAVINALLLGQRQQISKELLESYTNAGAIHILAISGLHVGIILYILLFLFKPLENLKNGTILKTILIVLLLWLFALVAGLSASVVRAVTMFTFVAIGQSFNKKQFIEHSLVASMFVLLLFKPLFLVDVGFQLSYTAVFGIVWIQPLLYKLVKVSFKAIDFFWKLITVSVSAQIAILPLSLYYFHQFPSLFLLSNLVIIPFLGGILLSGIIIIFLALLNILPQFLADFYGWIISLMNQFVSFISNQETFLFRQISMSLFLMLAWYIVIVLAHQLIIHQKIKRLLYFLGSVVLLQSVYLFEKHQRQTKQEFIVFHKSRESILGQRNGNTLRLFTNTYQHAQRKIINPYKINESVDVKTDSTTQNIYQFKNETILVIDSLGVYNLPMNNAMVILQQSPKINLNRMIQKLQPKQIIADGSNYKSYVVQWEKTCKQQKTPFHYTGQNGAFVISD